MRDARCEMRDARCEMRDARCEMRDARCEMRDARCEIKPMLSNQSNKKPLKLIAQKRAGATFVTPLGLTCSYPATMLLPASIR
ncbi:hypothetical protein C0W66_18380 [Photobacterium kishitanii]|nr:hypothetical protein C0W66_18380 [Photobacterium kishitanii]